MYLKSSGIYSLQKSIDLQKFNDTEFDLYFSMVSNAQIMHMIAGRPLTEQEARIRFEKMLMNNLLHDKLGSLKVIDATTQLCVGYAKMTIQQVEDTSAEIGYMFYPQYWGKGYGTATVTALLQIAETIPQLEKLIAIIDPDNAASRQLLTKHQFVSVKLEVIDDLPGEVLELQIK